jgi:hypothetical protein
MNDMPRWMRELYWFILKTNRRINRLRVIINGSGKSSIVTSRTDYIPGHASYTIQEFLDSLNE